MCKRSKNTNTENVLACFCKASIEKPHKEYAGSVFKAAYRHCAAEGFLGICFLCKGKLSNNTIVSRVLDCLKAQPRLIVQESLRHLLCKAALG